MSIVVFRDPDKWDIYFMKLARTASTLSKDRSTQLGAVVVGPDREIRSTGYNSFPRGINDNDPSRFERPKKYMYTAHAEANAVFNAARVGVSLKGCTLYCKWPPCNNCAIAIIQAGISTIVVEQGTVDRAEWDDSMIAAREMLQEAGVDIFIIGEVK